MYPLRIQKFPYHIRWLEFSNRAVGNIKQMFNVSISRETMKINHFAHQSLNVKWKWAKFEDYFLAG